MDFRSDNRNFYEHNLKNNNFTLTATEINTFANITSKKKCPMRFPNTNIFNILPFNDFTNITPKMKF